MSRMEASPYPQSEIEAGRVRADALVSIIGARDPSAAFAPSLFGGRILRLCFDDIPCGEWTDRHGVLWIGPTEAHMAEAIGFARWVSSVVDSTTVRIAVHCLHGKSRSAAVALALNADAMGPGREAEAVAALLSRSETDAHRGSDPIARMACNPGLVKMADRLLGRGGRIEQALEEALPRFVTWRKYWTERGFFRVGDDRQRLLAARLSKR